MLGAHLVTQALSRAGVTTVFSLSGNQIMPLYDACIDARIRIVHVRHEAAAVHMADAWAQVTGTIGVALLTAGPGLTNGLSPLFSARQAESPVLLLSGDSPVTADGTGAFQELGQITITQALVKRALRPMQAQTLDHDVSAAISLALSGRPGPVHVALPFDLLQQDVADDAIVPAETPCRVRTALPELQARAMAQALAQARRPLVLVGPMLNASRAACDHQAARTALQAPVIPMESPRGLRDPALGAFAEVLAQADMLVLLGKPLDFTLEHGRAPVFSPDVEVIVVDPDPSWIARAIQALGPRLRMHAVADADAALHALCAQDAPASRAAWLAHVGAALACRTVTTGQSAADPGVMDADKPGPQLLCTAVQALLQQVQNPILICDGGEFGQWAQACCSAPVRVMNGVAGGIGGSLCHAIAASLARPDATVVALMGDGTAGFHLAEFETAARAGARFIAVVGNDARWNAEHLIQLRDYGPERLNACTLSPSVRYDLAAQALGARGAYVRTLSELAPALHAAVQSRQPVCINVELKGQPAPVFASPGAAASPAAH